MFRIQGWIGKVGWWACGLKHDQTLSSGSTRRKPKIYGKMSAFRREISVCYHGPSESQKCGCACIPQTKGLGQITGNKACSECDSSISLTAMAGMKLGVRSALARSITCSSRQRRESKLLYIYNYQGLCGMLLPNVVRTSIAHRRDCTCRSM